MSVHEGLGSLVMAVGVAASNVAACLLIAALGETVYRSQIDLEYGFPIKQRLLCGYSDAPMESQIEGVLRLCEALGKSKFGPWDQVSIHGGSGGGMFGAIYSRLTSMAR